MLFLSDYADQLCTTAQFKQLGAEVLQEILAVCARKRRAGAAGTSSTSDRSVLSSPSTAST